MTDSVEWKNCECENTTVDAAPVNQVGVRRPVGMLSSPAYGVNNNRKHERGKKKLIREKEQANKNDGSFFRVQEMNERIRGKYIFFCDTTLPH